MWRFRCTFVSFVVGFRLYSVIVLGIRNGYFGGFLRLLFEVLFGRFNFSRSQFFFFTGLWSYFLGRAFVRVILGRRLGRVVFSRLVQISWFLGMIWVLGVLLKSIFSGYLGLWLQSVFLVQRGRGLVVFLGFRFFCYCWGYLGSSQLVVNVLLRSEFILLLC